MRKRVGIFGGSFNPPHNGHVEICRYLLKKNDLDQILVIPCFKHPFEKDLAEFKDRLLMCRFAFNEFGDKVMVSDVEKKIGNVSYTINTVKYMIDLFPDDKFYLIVGSDTEEESEGWKDINEIKSLVQFTTVPRGPKSHIPNISSTEVRKRIGSGIKFTDLVPSEVAVYIITHGLYS